MGDSKEGKTATILQRAVKVYFPSFEELDAWKTRARRAQASTLATG